MGPTLQQMAGLYFDGRIARGEITPGSARKMRQHVEGMIRAVGDRPVRKLDKACASAWKESVAHLAPSTQLLYHSTVNAFCEWLVDEEVLVRNPFRRMHLPKPPRRPPRALPSDSVARLLQVVPDIRARVIVLLMVQQGLRCGGVSALQVEDVDLQDRWMRVREKGEHERVLPITDECHEAITLYLSRFPAWSGPLVRQWKKNGGSQRYTELRVTDRPLTPESISKFMSEWMYEAGIKQAPRDGRSAHALRHTCATDMLDGGANITDVQATLGHANVSTTMIYTHVRPQRLVQAMSGRRYGHMAEAS